MDINIFIEYAKSYEGISEMIRKYDFNEIAAAAAQVLNVNVNDLVSYPMGGYSKGKTSGAYYYTFNDMQKNIDRYDEVYDMLEDERSKEVFLKLIQYRLLPTVKFLETAADTQIHQYFDKSFVECDENEVFVDCGGFIGDTVMDFADMYGKYKKIYTYEPSKENIKEVENNLKDYKNVVIRNCGVGEKAEKLPISGSSSSTSFLAASSNTDDNCDYVEIINLDEDIDEPVTFIKMDIEGFEIPALLGAKNHIKNDKPKLAICTYHIVSDMWEIPLLIKTINPDYKFYLRHYRPDVNWESVIYAIPPKKFKAPERKSKRVVALPWRNGWYNVEFAKDCGIIPYLLYKNHGAIVTMVGARTEELTYADTLVKGIKTEFLETGDIKEKIDYIIKNAKDIDLLIIRGAHNINASLP
ncbi:MAG: FkbM family methyltransferase, partial [Firmicutes bacterium]|nr:FkbM family methyltransferase [Bacillota bacterium]